MRADDDRRKRHEVERARALDLLERTFGKDGRVPLEVAAAVMPTLPEWDAHRLPRRRRTP